MKVRIYHDGSWSNEELKKMAEDKFLDRNGKRYGMCRECHKVVCLTKTFFGSLHLCD